MVVQKGRADAAMPFALVVAAVAHSHSVVAFAPAASRHLIQAPPTSKVGAREFCPAAICAASTSALDVATASIADEREASSPEPLASVEALDKLVPRQTIRQLSKQKSNTKGDVVQFDQRLGLPDGPGRKALLRDAGCFVEVQHLLRV